MLQPTESVKHLALSCYKAMQVIGGKECPKCGGKGYFPLSKERITVAPQHTSIDCPTCNGTGKVKWKWELQVGEYILLDDEIHLLFPTRDGLGFDAGMSCGRSTGYCEEKCYQDFTDSIKAKCIPILPWETIIKILETMGYVVTVIYEGGDELHKRGYCNIWEEDKCVVEVEGAKDCPEAVMLAVIKLGKELTNA